MALLGIHHITLVSSDARRTVDFYTGVLGLRLVKKTVNFDDPTSYHLYFGDEKGTPGTLLTFFEWKDAPKGHWGIGTTHHLALAVKDAEAQLMWKRYLEDQGIPVTGPYDRMYFRSLYFTDPDGLILEIATRGPGWTVDEPAGNIGSKLIIPPHAVRKGERDEAAIEALTWDEPVNELTEGMRLSGLHHITAIASDIGRTTAFYTELLGFRTVKQTLNFDDPTAPHLYYAMGDGRPGTIITYFGYPSGTMRRGRMGSGLTHHFAFAVEDSEQVAWREKLLEAGLEVSPVMERKYFRSIYFNDPDGHILEIATLGPGFFVDEAPADLGRRLTLPAWLEAERTQIEAELAPL